MLSVGGQTKMMSQFLDLGCKLSCSYNWREAFLITTFKPKSGFGCNDYLWVTEELTLETNCHFPYLKGKKKECIYETIEMVYHLETVLRCLQISEQTLTGNFKRQLSWLLIDASSQPWKVSSTSLQVLNYNYNMKILHSIPADPLA